MSNIGAKPITGVFKSAELPWTSPVVLRSVKTSVGLLQGYYARDVT